MTAVGGGGRVFWGAAATVLALDIATKFAAEQTLALHIPRRVIGDAVRFTLAYNPGAAFSMSLGPASRWIFGAFAAIALVVLWRWHREARPGEWLKHVALGCVWGGAAGNLYDRIRSAAGVVDFIDIGVGSLRFWTFNVADCGVTVGAVTLGVILLREERADAPATRDTAG